MSMQKFEICAAIRLIIDIFEVLLLFCHICFKIFEINHSKHCHFQELKQNSSFFFVCIFL